MTHSTSPLDDFIVRLHNANSPRRRRAPRIVPPRGLGPDQQFSVYQPKQARLDAHAAEMRERNQAHIRKRELALARPRGPNGWRFASREKGVAPSKGEDNECTK